MNNYDADSALQAIGTLRRIFPELEPSTSFDGSRERMDRLREHLNRTPDGGKCGNLTHIRMFLSKEGEPDILGGIVLSDYEQRAIAVRDAYLSAERRKYDEKMATPVDAGPFGMLDRRRTYTVTVKRMERPYWHAERPALDARGNQLTTTYKSLRPEWSSVKREGEVGASLLPYRGTIGWRMSSGNSRRIDIGETISITANEMPAAAKEGSK